jgi:hypothetical protein
MLSKRRPLSFNFTFRNEKNHRRQGLVSRDSGGWLSFSLKSKAAAQGVACGRAHCHGSGPRNCWATWLDVCTRHFPSATSEHRNRSFHWRSVWWNKFLMHNAFSVKKTNQHWFYIVSNLSCFLGSRWIWRLPLWWLLLRLRVVPINPKFITSNDGDEVGVIFGVILSSEQMATWCSFWSLLSSLVTYFAAMCRMLSSCNIICWPVPIVWKCHKHHESFAFVLPG